MEYKKLGNTGLAVSSLCLGTMNFGDSTDEKTAVRIVNEFLHAGGNFIDTANIYSYGESEKITGKALKEHRHDVVLATKVSRPMAEGPNRGGNGRLHIMEEIDNSLKRLGTDYIDIYWIHRPDPPTPIEETMRTLDMLVRSGKVRYIGCSTFPAWRIVEALWVSDKRNQAGFIAEQPPYSIFERRVERRVFSAAEAYGLGIVSWSPLAGGWLADKFRGGEKPASDTRIARFSDAELFTTEGAMAERRFAVLEQLRPMADELGTSMACFSLAWVMSNPMVTSPIIGPRTLDHLHDYMKVFDVDISSEHMARIDELVPSGTSIWHGDEYVDYI